MAPMIVDVLAQTPEGASVIAVDARVLRRVIKRHRHLPGFGLDVPHSEVIALRRDEFERAAGEGPITAQDVADHLIVIARGEPESERPRRVLHARVHLAIARRAPSAARIKRVVHLLGQTEVDEIRATLRADDRLLAADDPVEVFAEIAALYAELRTFAPDELVRTFPALAGRERRQEEIDALFEEEIGEGLLPERRASPRVEARAETSLDRGPKSSVRGSDAKAGNNDVRAALAALASKGDPEPALRSLAARLDAVLFGHDGKAATDDDPIPFLRALAERAQGGMIAPIALSISPWIFQRVEARLLYDLQRACLAVERPSRAIDLLGWAGSFGKKPLVRELPAAAPLRVLDAMRDALRKLPRTSLTAPDRATRERGVATNVDRALGEKLLRAWVHRAEHNVRAALGPAITNALTGAGLVPRDLPEQVGADKVVAELLDVVLAKGRLGIGQLRDAISKNPLKMGDLRAHELWSGDALLLADKALAGALDGVYRRGEAYLRGLQKVSSVAFGTGAGRFLVRYLALPLLGSFVLLEGVTHLLHPIMKLAGYRHKHVHLLSPTSLLALAALIFALIHSQTARSVAKTALSAVGYALSVIFVAIPRWVWSRAMVQGIVHSRVVVALGRWAIKPLLVPAVAYLFLPRAMRHDPKALAALGAGFLALSFALNSKVGLTAQEIVADKVSRTAKRLVKHLLPGLLRLVMDVFSRLVELSERGIYAVDERLRFRQGENPIVVGIKALFGAIFAVIAYLVRLYVNLLIEPQVNPIKHFPVVTVSHKIILPLTPALLGGLLSVLTPAIGSVAAKLVGGTTIVLLPGVFGFLVWELKENYRLYRASRARALAPVPVGHHGETIVGLLRPGFHSGTLPKLFTKLRRAERNNSPLAIRHRAAIAEVEEAVQGFVERELVRLLSSSVPDLSVTSVDLGSNRIVIAVSKEGALEGPCLITFEEQSGLIVAAVRDLGFVEGLDERGKIAFENALAGLYAKAGADLVRQRVEEALARSLGRDKAPPYDVADEGIVAWSDEAYEVEIVYPLAAPVETIEAWCRGERGRVDVSPAPVARRAMMFQDVITWERWVEIWSDPGKARCMERGGLL